MSKKVLIGITRGAEDSSVRSPALYIQSVERAGGKAEFIPLQQDAGPVVRHYSGFIIPGGRDLDPSLYGEEGIFEIACEEKGRVDFENTLLREIMKAGKPILGICYGMQLLNVFFGGSLYQDIAAQTAGSSEHRKGAHRIRVIRNPYMHGGWHKVPSSHHQAVKILGSGMRAFAYAEDGIIEGCYHADYGFLMGVQFHAERMNTHFSEKIFGAFVGACHGQG